MRFYERALVGWAWLGGRPALRRVNNLFLNLGLRGLGIGNGENLTGEHELLARLAPAWRRRGAEAVLMDVGANEGGYSAALRRLCPQARIIAFEAHPATAARLRARLGSAVEIESRAVGAEPGEATLWDYAQRSGTAHASLQPGVIEDLHHGQAVGVPVEVTSLDAFCAQKDVGHIDLLKLDVEGHELACLRGAQRMIREGRVGIVQFEFNIMHAAARTYFHDFAALLPGCRFYRLLPHGLMKLPADDLLRCNLYGVQNLLAVPERPGAAHPVPPL